jgi:hypothetical protein
VSPASAGLTVRWRYRSRSRFSRAVSSSTNRAIARRISALRSRSPAGSATATISYIFSTAGTFVLTPCYSGDSNYGPINTVP